MSGKGKVFFPSMNGLRFIAAFGVIIHHLEQIKLFFGLPSAFFTVPFIKPIGDLGVTLFFVLSGFLITYLLLSEKERFQTVDVGKFYIRRILRIWPLYYLIITLGLFVLPHIHFFDIPLYTEKAYDHFGVKVLLYYSLFPNIVGNVYAYMPYISQTWSIGIEEQFYYVWPWIIKFTKNYLRALLTIVIGLLVVTNALSFFAFHGEDLSGLPSKIKIITQVFKIFSSLRIGCMAIGGIGAYYLFYLRLPVLRFVFSKYTQIATFLIVLTMLGFGMEIPYAQHEIYSLFFIVIILNLAANPDCLGSLENKTMDYLGKISYSLYMWHSIALICALHLARLINPRLDDLTSNAFYYSTAIALSIALSAASYELFEMQFLKFKHLFAKVQSGNMKEAAPAEETPPVPVASSVNRA